MLGQGGADAKGVIAGRLVTEAYIILAQRHTKTVYVGL